MRLLLFVVTAVYRRNAYIDLDGCLLHKFSVPFNVKKNRLQWWMDNLSPTPIVKRRLWMLYLLKLFGVKLHIWTNRSLCHAKVTQTALGKHMRLFSGVYFMGGKKDELPRFGPCIDDEPKYVIRFGDVCVSSK